MQDPVELTVEARDQLAVVAGDGGRGGELDREPRGRDQHVLPELGVAQPGPLQRELAPRRGGAARRGLSVEVVQWNLRQPREKPSSLWRG